LYVGAYGNNTYQNTTMSFFKFPDNIIDNTNNNILSFKVISERIDFCSDCSINPLTIEFCPLFDQFNYTTWNKHVKGGIPQTNTNLCIEKEIILDDTYNINFSSIIHYWKTNNNFGMIIKPRNDLWKSPDTLKKIKRNLKLITLSESQEEEIEYVEEGSCFYKNQYPTDTKQCAPGTEFYIPNGNTSNPSCSYIASIGCCINKEEITFPINCLSIINEEPIFFKDSNNISDIECKDDENIPELSETVFFCTGLILENETECIENITNCCLGLEKYYPYISSSIDEEPTLIIESTGYCINYSKTFFPINCSLIINDHNDSICWDNLSAEQTFYNETENISIFSDCRWVQSVNNYAEIEGNAGINSAYALCEPGEKVVSGGGKCIVPGSYTKTNISYLSSSIHTTRINDNDIEVEAWQSTCIGYPTTKNGKSSKNIVTAICCKDFPSNDVTFTSNIAEKATDLGLNYAIADCEPEERVLSGGISCISNWTYPRINFSRNTVSAYIMRSPEVGPSNYGWQSRCTGIPSEEELKSSKVISKAICVDQSQYENCRVVYNQKYFAFIKNDYGKNTKAIYCNSDEKMISGGSTCYSNFTYNLSDSSFTSSSSPTTKNVSNVFYEGWKSECIGIPSTESKESSRNHIRITCCK